MTWQTKAWRTPSARQERIENKSNAMREWCFQCGVAQRPQRAVGWDEDGEPACSGHAQRAANPLKLDQPAEVQVEETPVSVHSYPGQFVNEEVEETAAPSPVQTSAKEKQMKTCAGFEKECGKPLGEHNSTGICTTCYARKKYRDKHPTKTQGQSVDKVGGSTYRDAELTPLVEVPQVTLRLTIPQAERLIKALLF